MGFKSMRAIIAVVLLSCAALAQTNLGPIRVTTTEEIGTAASVTLPAAGDCKHYYNLNTGVETWVNSAGGNCGPTASGTDFPIVTPKTVGTGGSISSTGIGQVVANGLVAPNSIQTPSASITSTSGGSLSSSGFNSQVTFNTAAGETYASAIVFTSMSTCTTTCIVTLVAPSLPAGVTGYTAYTCSTGANCTPKRQTASAGCVNITGNCIVSVAGTGAAAPTSNTAFFQPANIQANECPGGTIPFIFTADQSFNLHTAAGVDLNSNNGQTSGTLEFCRRTWFTDQQITPPPGNNAFMVIDHTAGVGTSASNQDRALWVSSMNPPGDTATRYALETIQAQQTFQGAPAAINGSPDGEVSAGSFQTQDLTTNSGEAPPFGINAVRCSNFRNGSGAGWQLYPCVISTVSDGGSVAAAPGTIFTAFYANTGETGVGSPGAFGVGYLVKPPGTAGRLGINLGVWAISNSFTPSGLDNFALNDIHNWNSYLNDGIGINAIASSDLASMAVSASIAAAGSLNVAAEATNWTATTGPPTCTGGSSTYNYVLVAVDSNGGASKSATLTSIGTCTNPLTSGNPASIAVGGVIGTIGNFTTGTPFSESSRIDVYRTGGPMATGKIGSITCAGGFHRFGCTTFSDTGLSADGGSVPASNTTGGVSAAGYSSLNGNKAEVATNFTTAANTNLQVITGLTLPLPTSAAKVPFHCSIGYSQATANAAVAFGIQAATINPSNIFATGSIQTNTTAFSGGVLPTLTTTTATAIVSATPAATATNFIATLDGTIENAANDAGNLINILVSTATAADAVTILRGSECYLY